MGIRCLVFEPDHERGEGICLVCKVRKDIPRKQDDAQRNRNLNNFDI